MTYIKPGPYPDQTDLPKRDSHAAGNPCEICGITDNDKPTCFTREPYCCEDHRKAIILLASQ